MAKQVSMRDSLYLSEDPNETTFKYDQQLPSLPVPTIKQSVFKLLDTIRPITEGNDEAYREVERKALALLQDASVNEVQGLLEKRAREKRNWLEEWWLEFAYLRSRKPLIPYSNMAAPLPILKHWPKLLPDDPQFDTVRAQRASLSTYFQLCFWNMIRLEQMRPMIHKGVPWSMNQFRYLFNTCRRPGEPMDELVSWFRTAREGPPESIEIIVLYRGYIHAIKPVTLAANNQISILSAPQIERQLRTIENWCKAQPQAGPGIGVLTTNERSVWKEMRDELANISQHNQRLLDRIERGLSVLVLDDHCPSGTQEIFELCMADGQSVDRWADKSITSIAFKNGTFGANADHTPYDGFCTGIMTHYLMTSVEECNGQWNSQLQSSSAVYQEPELLDFQLSPQINVSLRESLDHLKTVCSTIDVLHETFSHFGKALLKDHRFHPEAFVQCAIHAAYFRQHGKMAPAYVTASTRRFHNGRTETCRSCYNEMRDLAKFINENPSGGDVGRQKATYNLLKKSVTRFQELMNEASNGMGCDRHLMGIYLTAIIEGRKIPELFDDELVQRTNNYILSTSCSGYWNVCGGVPPLVEDGYGCFYGIEDNAITFGITAHKTSKETDMRLFYKNLTNILLELQRVLLSTKL